MIKMNVNITSSKILAMTLAIAGVIISLILKDASAFEIGAFTSAALMGTKTVTERFRTKDKMDYNQGPKEIIN